MTQADAILAARLAHEAGELLRTLRREHGPGDGGRELRDAGDRAAQRYLSEALAAERPDDAVLSEEAADDEARLEADRVWIVDPLDGTREFAEGRADWAVHVALWAGGRLAAGAVALPGLGTTVTSDPPPQLPQRTSGVPRIAVSRSRPPEVAERAARELSAELVPMGSAGYKATAVVRGEVDAYVHAGGQYEWDSAAPAAVALAAGVHASRLDGSPLQYNNADTYLPDLLVARPELAEALLAAVSGPEADPIPAVPRSAR
ncbi:3'(2'),5'-bisphosphate nucleotidase [Haloactinopolyspora alba]|uniref:3'(2'),5'-bisphosphate nucleotidase n=1 Tax=Haloactinopolyspora alba TaxID=648780 RepID=A0A2P8E5G8_9ACTN|nr:3'(2'),5'-bisphosphate nucleotidase CysQ [Haloactinopolyspora alba]PSL04716.1 3'(2'),5'-bisphosphate nucleotidase [Haloactinopolyspora alba]